MTSFNSPHGHIKEIIPNIFMVTGTNIIEHNNLILQHSRNMIIIRESNTLSLISTVRLQENELKVLESLGNIQNIIRIGAFHGRDDLFYLDRYNAKLWALKGMVHEHGHATDVELIPNSKMPFANASLFLFETAKLPEAIIHIASEVGILITCDSIKNWLSADKYFSIETAELYEQQGFFGAATITDVWVQACQVANTDFKRLKNLSFKHLFSAHGEPLLNIAYDAVTDTIRKKYGF
jgi:hypothetical protein